MTEYSQQVLDGQMLALAVHTACEDSPLGTDFLDEEVMGVWIYKKYGNII